MPPALQSHVALSAYAARGTPGDIREWTQVVLYNLHVEEWLALDLSQVLPHQFGAWAFNGAAAALSEPSDWLGGQVLPSWCSECTMR